MSTQRSFTKLKQEFIPSFRERMNHAESDADIRRQYFQFCRDFFAKVLDAELVCEFDDIKLVTDQAPYYLLSTELDRQLAPLVNDNSSDFGQILEQFSKQAAHHLKHKQQCTEKTELKINHR